MLINLYISRPTYRFILIYTCGLTAVIKRIWMNEWMIYTARPDPTKQIVSASAMYIGFSTTQDFRRQRIWSLNTLTAIIQFTPPCQTRHWQDCFVVSGVAVWTGSARPLDRCVLCRVCVGVCRSAAAPRRRPAMQLGLAARPPTRSDVVRHAKCKHAVGVMTAACDKA